MMSDKNLTKAELESKVKVLTDEVEALSEALKEAHKRLSEYEKVKGPTKQATVKTKEGTFLVKGSGVSVDGKVYTCEELKFKPEIVVELHKRGSGLVTKIK